MASHLPAIDASTQIRLLTLPPACSGSNSKTSIPLSAQISVADVDQKPPYNCISYVWGTGQATETIVIGSVAVPITESLHSALSYISSLHPDEPVVLWVDSLCINQAHDAEKSRQVSMMKDIYSGCENCYIWLGYLTLEAAGATPISPAGSPSLTNAAIATATAELIGFLADSGNHETDILPASLSHPQGILAGVGLAIAGAMKSSWWTRIWTVQECVVCSRATLLGPPLVAAVDWQAFLDAGGALVYLHEFATQHQIQAGLLGAGSGAGSPHEAIVSAALGTYSGITVPLGNLRSGWLGTPMDSLWRHSSRRATDPRDIVYAAIPIMDEGSLSNVPVDYSLSTSAVFRAVTRDLLRSENSLKPLVGRTRRTFEERGVDGEEGRGGVMPSWVLDWERVRFQMNWWDHSYIFEQFDAARGLPPLDVEALSEDMLGPRLRLRGIRLDSVHVHILPDDSGAVPVESNTERWHRSLKNATAELLVASHGYNHTAAAAKTDEMTGAIDRAVAGLMISDQNPDPGVLGKTIRDVWTENIEPEHVLFVTKSAQFGFGPAHLQAGDEVWILCGGKVPFMLRPVDSGAAARGGERVYEFIGNVYLEGNMWGEAVDANKEKLEEIFIE